MVWDNVTTKRLCTANGLRTQQLRDQELSGKDYNITNHVVIEHWPPRDFHRQQVKNIDHPSQHSLESQRNLQGTIGGKILNHWGAFYAFTTLFTALTLFPLMILFSGLCDISGNGKRRRALDWVIHVWARITMTLTTSKIKVYGLSNLPAHNETVVYIPNHTSYFDIPLLSGYIPRPFKYLSKAEIMRIPLVGFGMRLAKHVFLIRNDAKSVEEVGEMCVQRLLDGNSMLLFAEGSRSVDGKLHKFKKGAFHIAKSANVSIVPVSISNMHYFTPKDSVLPVAPI
eukprot:gene28083-34884_t